MPFAYYRRLSPSRRSIYRRSDGITTVPLPSAEPIQRLVPALSAALQEEDPGSVQAASQAIADRMLLQLEVPAVQVIILDSRPSNSCGELHGLYEPSDAPYRSRITLWMRTAQQERVVAFKTFLRTLLHELLHHLDYEHFELQESFHTEGFYKRESSLFHQLVPRSDRGRSDRASK